MKNIVVFAILSLIILSCKKDTLKPSQPEVADATYSHVSTTGSYWVYNWYQVDSTGGETLITSLKDTIRIVGDTTINGKVYQKFKGKDMGINTEYYNRDSIGYVVGPNGSIFYSYVAEPMLLRTTNDGLFNYQDFIGEQGTINTVFGNKNAFSTYREISMIDGSPVNVCGDLSIRFYNHYVSGLGRIQSEMEYLGNLQSQCSKKRAKLSAFYIAP